MKADSFKIEAHLVHASMLPSEIAEALSIRPRNSRKVGDRLGVVLAKWTSWCGVLAEGAASSDFDESLKTALTELESHREWLSSFLENGELDIVFSFCTDLKEGLINEAEFDPELVERLANLNAGIKFQVWMDEQGGGSHTEAE